MKRIFLIMIAFGVCFFEVPVDAYEKSLKNVKVVMQDMVVLIMELLNMVIMKIILI